MIKGIREIRDASGVDEKRIGVGGSIAAGCSDTGHTRLPRQENHCSGTCPERRSSAATLHTDGRINCVRQCRASQCQQRHSKNEQPCPLHIYPRLHVETSRERFGRATTLLNRPSPLGMPCTQESTGPELRDHISAFLSATCKIPSDPLPRLGHAAATFAQKFAVTHLCWSATDYALWTARLRRRDPDTQTRLVGESLGGLFLLLESVGTANVPEAGWAVGDFMLRWPAAGTELKRRPPTAPALNVCLASPNHV